MSETNTVLVVEDNEIILADTADLLRGEGCAVLEANSYSGAMAQLAALPEGSVLITDIRLSGSHTGLDLIKTVGARRPDLRIIVMSGVIRPDTDNFPEHALFCTKPCASGVLPALIKEARVWS
jgi:DNA-binding NtrC family response regulator